MAKKVTYRQVNIVKSAIWQKGAPPHIGLWNAAVAGLQGISKDKWRWWNGSRWSAWCVPSDKADAVINDLSREGAFQVDDLLWRYNWPCNARVARINPETGECTGAGPCPYETNGKPWPFKNR